MPTMDIPLYITIVVLLCACALLLIRCLDREDRIHQMERCSRESDWEKILKLVQRNRELQDKVESLQAELAAAKVRLSLNPKGEVVDMGQGD